MKVAETKVKIGKHRGSLMASIFHNCGCICLRLSHFWHTQNLIHLSFIITCSIGTVFQNKTLFSDIDYLTLIHFTFSSNYVHLSPVSLICYLNTCFLISVLLYQWFLFKTSPWTLYCFKIQPLTPVLLKEFRIYMVTMCFKCNRFFHRKLWVTFNE